MGFTKLCASLLSSSNLELRDIPAQMLKQVSYQRCHYGLFNDPPFCQQLDRLMSSSLTFTFQGLHVLQSPRCTSVTRRAAGLPMLILCIVSAEETSKSRPLLAHSVHTLLETARTPLPQNWDQTLDLPQVINGMDKK